MSADLLLFRWLYGPHGQVWLATMSVLTVVGSGWTMIPIASLAAFKRTRAHALWLIALLVSVSIAVFSIKALVGRARPCSSLAEVHALVFHAPTDPSFPSGHAAGAFAVAAFVTFELAVHPLAKVAMFVIAAGIGLSRIVLGVHFPSDVLAGALLGIVAALSVSASRRTFQKRKWNAKRAQSIL